MYMPGRRRTASRPSRTVMSPASYCVVADGASGGDEIAFLLGKIVRGV
jgi:hypothetical protein